MYEGNIKREILVKKISEKNRLKINIFSNRNINIFSLISVDRENISFHLISFMFERHKQFGSYQRFSKPAAHHRSLSLKNNKTMLS